MGPRAESDQMGAEDRTYGGDASGHGQENRLLRTARPSARHLPDQVNKGDERDALQLGKDTIGLFSDAGRYPVLRR